MRLLLLIGTGSFIGGIARYLLSQWIATIATSSFPAGTLLVNISGCFVIGIVYGIGEKAQLPPEWRLFLMAGICGGFTTFSAFGLETVALLRDGQTLVAVSYIMASVLAGLLATVGGIFLLR